MKQFLLINNFHFQNKWITQAVFMKDYVEILQKTVDAMRDYVDSPDDVWTEEIHEDWIGKQALMGGGDVHSVSGCINRNMTKFMTQVENNVIMIKMTNTPFLFFLKKYWLNYWHNL